MHSKSLALFQRGNGPKAVLTSPHHAAPAWATPFYLVYIIALSHRCQPCFFKKLLHFVLAYANILRHSKSAYAPLAQLDRASGYGPEGRGFESLTAYQIIRIPKWVSGLFLFSPESGLYVLRRVSLRRHRPGREPLFSRIVFLLNFRFGSILSQRTCGFSASLLVRPSPPCPAGSGRLAGAPGQTGRLAQVK
jgi:hypothetical protein